jgi:hypothetical protein
MDNDNGMVFLNVMIGYAEVFAQSMAMWLGVYVQAKRGEVKQVERSATAHARVTWHAAAAGSNRMEGRSRFHRHAARMKAQRIAWNIEYGLPGGNQCFAGPDTQRGRLGRGLRSAPTSVPATSISSAALAPRRSESRTPTDVVVCSLRHMTARCIDAQGDGRISA